MAVQITWITSSDCQDEFMEINRSITIRIEHSKDVTRMDINVEKCRRQVMRLLAEDAVFIIWSFYLFIESSKAFLIHTTRWKIVDEFLEEDAAIQQLRERSILLYGDFECLKRTFTELHLSFESPYLGRSF